MKLINNQHIDKKKLPKLTSKEVFLKRIKDIDKKEQKVLLELYTEIIEGIK